MVPGKVTSLAWAGSTEGLWSVNCATELSPLETRGLGFFMSIMVTGHLGQVCNLPGSSGVEFPIVLEAAGGWVHLWQKGSRWTLTASAPSFWMFWKVEVITLIPQMRSLSGTARIWTQV